MHVELGGGFVRIVRGMRWRVFGMEDAGTWVWYEEEQGRTCSVGQAEMRLGRSF